MEKIKVYNASKLHRAAMWLPIKNRWPEVQWMGDWSELYSTWTPEEAIKNNLEAVVQSNFLLLYLGENDQLVGALLEVGLALYIDIDIYVVYPAKESSSHHPSLHDWAYHPNVAFFKTVDEALELITQQVVKVPKTIHRNPTENPHKDWEGINFDGPLASP